MSKLFGPDTLKDEYHVSLSKALARLHITDVERILALRTERPATYQALAVLAHEHGHMALYEGLKVFWDQ